jgi:gamma-glutamylcyclotransferase (GGCT)/AIG2-like uncharacterized protein YtfP
LKQKEALEQKIEMLLFVYGTLMSDLSNNWLLQNAKLIGKGTTKKKFSIHVSGTIPFLHDDEKEYKICGELYMVFAEELEEIDKLESNGDWYIRRLILVVVNGEEHLAWVYFNNEKGLKLDHGDFDRYISDMTIQFYR